MSQIGKPTAFVSLLVLLLCWPLWAQAEIEEGFDFDDSPRIIGLHAPDWFELSFLDLPEDLERAVERGKQGLAVYYGMDDCPYCEQLFEVNFEKEDIRAQLSDNFDVVAIDVLGDREVTGLDGEVKFEREYASEQRLNFTPSIAFYDADGERIHQMRGYYPPYRFRALLDFVTERHDREMSFRDYLDRADPPPKLTRTTSTSATSLSTSPMRWIAARSPRNGPWWCSSSARPAMPAISCIPNRCRKTRCWTASP